MGKLYLLNAPVMPNEGVYIYNVVSKEKFIESFNHHKELGYEVISAIGHQSTADFLTRILGYPVQYNRINIEFKDGDMALVVKIKTRLQEGQVLTDEDLEKIEVEFGTIFYRPAYYGAYI
jgi:hypothetical protein